MVTLNKISRLYELLEKRYGDLHWWPGDTDDEILIGAILTQNTSWSNVERSLSLLKEKQLLSIDKLALAEPETVAQLIRSSGFYNQKAERLVSISKAISGSGGYQFLRSLPARESEQFLLSLKGIGSETAESILCYILGKMVFVVDKYTMRIFGRIEIPGTENKASARITVEHTLGESKSLGNFHATLVQLGKEHCKTKPVCKGCPANSICGFYESLISP